ncbi:MAG: NfeD family protein [Gammaproteobacteria bacterium]|nr:NfeD family protein [Gammaproteobacteria bacterium]
MEFAEQMTYWHWWVLAVVFVVLEIFSPAAFFLWMGVAAGLVGLVLLVLPDINWEWQLLIFALFSLASILVSRRYLDRNPIATDQPHLNRRGEQYLDRTFTLDAPIVNGYGKIRVDDSSWKVEGDDCPAGTRVRVIGVDGVILQVEKIEVAQ